MGQTSSKKTARGKEKGKEREKKKERKQYHQQQEQEEVRQTDVVADKSNGVTPIPASGSDFECESAPSTFHAASESTAVVETDPDAVQPLSLPTHSTPSTHAHLQSLSHQRKDGGNDGSNSSAAYKFSVPPTPLSPPHPFVISITPSATPVHATHKSKPNGSDQQHSCTPPTPLAAHIRALPPSRTQPHAQPEAVGGGVVGVSFSVKLAEATVDEHEDDEDEVDVAASRKLMQRQLREQADRHERKQSQSARLNGCDDRVLALQQQLASQTLQLRELEDQKDAAIKQPENERKRHADELAAAMESAAASSTATTAAAASSIVNPIPPPETDRTTLLTTHRSLLAAHDTLQSESASLKSRIDSLSTLLQQKESSHNELESKLNLMRKERDVAQGFVTELRTHAIEMEERHEKQIATLKDEHRQQMKIEQQEKLELAQQLLQAQAALHQALQRAKAAEARVAQLQADFASASVSACASPSASNGAHPPVTDTDISSPTSTHSSSSSSSSTSTQTSATASASMTQLAQSQCHKLEEPTQTQTQTATHPGMQRQSTHDHGHVRSIGDSMDADAEFALFLEQRKAEGATPPVDQQGKQKNETTGMEKKARLHHVESDPLSVAAHSNVSSNNSIDSDSARRQVFPTAADEEDFRQWLQQQQKEAGIDVNVHAMFTTMPTGQQQPRQSQSQSHAVATTVAPRLQHSRSEDRNGNGSEQLSNVAQQSSSKRQTSNESAAASASAPASSVRAPILRPSSADGYSESKEGELEFAEWLRMHTRQHQDNEAARPTASQTTSPNHGAPARSYSMNAVTQHSRSSQSRSQSHGEGGSHVATVTLSSTHVTAHPDAVSTDKRQHRLDPQNHPARMTKTTAWGHTQAQTQQQAPFDSSSSLSLSHSTTSDENENVKEHREGSMSMSMSMSRSHANPVTSESILPVWAQSQSPAHQGQAQTRPIQARLMQTHSQTQPAHHLGPLHAIYSSGASVK